VENSINFALESLMHPQLPQLSPLNKIFIIIIVALFLVTSVSSLAGLDLLGYTALSLYGLTRGFIHTLITFPFIETQLLGVLFNGLILWFLGSELEFQFGPRRYIGLLASCFGGGALLFLVLSMFSSSMSWMAGAGSASVGLCVVYALMYPDRPFVFMLLFPMKAKFFCMILVAISLYQGIFSGSKAQAFGQLGAMAAAWIFMGVVMGNWGPLKVSKKSSNNRAKLKLVKKDDDDTPKYWH
jgi:membrane associated rhomboid family serine protease